MTESPEPLITVAAIVAGAGTSGAIAGIVKNFAPAIAPDIAAAVAGGLLYFFGERVHPLVKAYGVGVLAGGLKGTIEKAIPAIGGGGSSSSSSHSHSSNPSPQGMPPASLAARAYVSTRSIALVRR